MVVSLARALGRQALGRQPSRLALGSGARSTQRRAVGVDGVDRDAMAPVTGSAGADQLPLEKAADDDVRDEEEAADTADFSGGGVVTGSAGADGLTRAASMLAGEPKEDPSEPTGVLAAAAGHPPPRSATGSAGADSLPRQR